MSSAPVPSGPRPIAMTDLAARHLRVGPAVEAAVVAVLRSGRYIGGPTVDAAEARVAALLGRQHGVGVNSGTDALAMALKALGVGPGDEVIVPALSFFATVESVLHTGARPVLVDVREDRPLIDWDLVRAAMSPRTRAIVPVHLFGDDAGGLPLGPILVDDAAQAVGASPPCGRGLLSAVSFYPTKVLGAAGDGGLVATDDPELALRVRRLGSHGMPEANLHERVAGHVGGNTRLDAVQAAVLLAHLDDLPARLARRRAIAARLDQVLGDLVVPRDPGGPVSVYCIRHPARDRLRAALTAQGIATALYYPRPMSAQPLLGGDLESATRLTPQATRFCAEALALPCHETLDDQDLDRLVDALRASA